MKVVNSQSSEDHEINADNPQGSLFGPPLFLLFINDLGMNILISLGNIYGDDITVYGYTFKKYDRSFAAYFFSGLALTAQL